MDRINEDASDASGHQTAVRPYQDPLPWSGQERRPVECTVRAVEPVDGAQATAGDDREGASATRKEAGYAGCCGLKRPDRQQHARQIHEGAGGLECAAQFDCLFRPSLELPALFHILARLIPPNKSLACSVTFMIASAITWELLAFIQLLD